MKRCSEASLNVNSKDKHRFVAFIPVRGGSKSIPLKNIKNFCGKPLLYWSVKAASECEQIATVFVATEDIRIREVVESFALPKVQVIDRSPETVTDTASTEAALLEFAQKHDFENIVLIQATSPLLEKEDLAGGITKYTSNQADSVVSVVRQKRFIWEQRDALSARPINYNPLQRPRRQDWEGFFVENGAFYITSRARLLESKCRISGNITLYEMPEETYFEIDEPSDWLIAEQLKSSFLNENLNIDFNRINLLVSDVDGVLTDAGMYYSDKGDELKKFNTKDGKGLELLRNKGIKVMFLTSENINLVRRRADKLKVDYVFLGVGDKKKFLEDFFKESEEFGFHQTAYIGDDINDLECLEAAMFSAAPADAVQQVKDTVLYNCRYNGGQGCVREVCDMIISGRKND